MSKDKVREMIEAIVPEIEILHYKGSEFPEIKQYREYRARVIDALANEAYIEELKCEHGMFPFPTFATDEMPTHVQLRLKPQPINKKVKVGEIIAALRDDDYTRMHAEIADRIEAHGIEEES